ncbi:MAG: hypothetical protein WDN67_01050 [Candidatus Moraniibacteriota bacterium]
MSLWMVLAPQAGVNAMVFWETDNSFTANVFLSGSQVGLQYYNGASYYTGSDGTPRAQAQVFGSNLSGSALHTHLRENVITNAGQAAAGLNQVRIGTDNGTLGNEYSAAFHYWGSVLYPSLSTGDQLTLRQGLEDIFFRSDQL